MMKLVSPISESDHFLGPTSANVILVMYGSYECPHSARAQIFVRDVHKWMRNLMCFAFRHFPLEQLYPHAFKAAEAAAAQKKLFWEMHDYLYDH